MSNLHLLLITSWLFLFIRLPSQTRGSQQLSRDFTQQTSNNQQIIYRYSHDVQWSCFGLNSNSSGDAFDCCRIFRIQCTQSGPSLAFGRCTTYNGVVLSIGLCKAYFQPNSYNLTVEMGTPLPIHLKDLNSSMCGPLNRKGLLCSECADGFGLSVTSLGYKCINCASVWYAVPLLFCLTFVPVTLFYLFILFFQVGVTSPPMPCFIMFAQFVLYTVNSERFKMITTEDGHLPLGIKITQVFYGLFSLDYFRYIISPPICLSSNLRSYHLTLFDYVTAFYPLFLIFMIWVCVELHDRNVRFIVWLWRPFHKCFVKIHKQWDRRSDILDVFITFFILSYYKFLYLASVFMNKEKIVNIDQFGNHSTFNRAAADPNIVYLSRDHLLLLSFSSIVVLIFNILPTLLLLLYPTRMFRACLSKCHLNSLSITIFTDKIQSCYRNGLDGGRDMRSFSVFYFCLRITFHLISLTFYKLLKESKWTSLGMTFFIAALVIALIRPYRKLYMNTIDALLLVNAALICFSINQDHRLQVTNLAVLLVSPIVGMSILLLLKVVRYKRCLQKAKALTIVCFNSFRLRRAKAATNTTQESGHDTHTDKHPLLKSLSADVDYGTAKQ